MFYTEKRKSQAILFKFMAVAAKLFAISYFNPLRFKELYLFRYKSKLTECDFVENLSGSDARGLERE